MPEASNSLPKRKRGGQPGNRNRLVHGRYTQAEAASRADIRAIRRKGRALVILVDNVLKARKALKRRRAAQALAAASAEAHLRRPASSRAKAQCVTQRGRRAAQQNERSAVCRQSSRSPPHVATAFRPLSSESPWRFSDCVKAEN